VVFSPIASLITALSQRLWCFCHSFGDTLVGSFVVAAVLASALACAVLLCDIVFVIVVSNGYDIVVTSVVVPCLTTDAACSGGLSLA